VYEDPSENKNLAEEFPDVVSTLKEEILAAQKKSLSRADYPKGIKAGWPKYHDGYISTGWCQPS